MATATRVLSKIIDSTVEYLDTAYLTKYPDFNEARRRLVRDMESGPTFREALYEIQDRYPLSGQDAKTFIASSNVLPGAKNDEEMRIVASVLSNITSEELYKHQVDALSAALLQERNVAITTGTGSGKTLAFLLPTLVEIFREALGDDTRARWTLAGKGLEEPWWRKTPLEFKARRPVHARLPGIRAMLMYPLNALVQDQVENLRRALDSREADNMYRILLNGERIFFGQYNGATLGSGSRDVQSNLKECARKLILLEDEFKDVDEAHRARLARPFGSELLTRWDMQDAPPDILITNYSMLAVMLVRERENNMLQATRHWLESDRRNRFSLVIDELHSYRGTAGTEVSYILKTFLARIGLSPDHPQLRIITTSASLDSGTNTGEGDPKFLSDFFGTSPKESRFRVISRTKDNTPCGVHTSCEPARADICRAVRNRRKVWRESGGNLQTAPRSGCGSNWEECR